MAEEYEESPNIVKVFDFETLLPNLRNDIIILLVGKKRSGKSIATRHIMYTKRNEIDHAIVFSKTETADNKYYSNFIPNVYIDNHINDTLLARYMHMQKNMPHRGAGMVVVDDMISDKQSQHDPNLKELFIANRHSKTFLFFITQRFKKAETTLRDNADFVILFHDDNTDNIKQYYEAYGTDLFNKFEDFRTIFFQITSTKYQAMVIHVTSCDPDKRLYFYKAKHDIPDFKFGSKGFHLAAELWQKENAQQVEVTVPRFSNPFDPKPTLNFKKKSLKVSGNRVFQFE